MYCIDEKFVQFCRELVGNSKTVGEVVQLQYKEIAKMDVKDYGWESWYAIKSLFKMGVPLIKMPYIVTAKTGVNNFDHAGTIA